MEMSGSTSGYVPVIAPSTSQIDFK
jgi:hypothetical protein